MKKPTPKLPYPNRKISETFLDFAAPILQDLPPKERELLMQKALEVAVTVWNSVVFADVLNDHHYLAETRRLIANKPEAALHIEQLIARKREFFGDDDRMIGNWKIMKTKNGLNLRADAQDTHAMLRHPK